jgi:hypothetical protein
LKIAVTVQAWLIVTWQAPVPEQAPLQPANTEPVPGVAVSVTTAALSNDVPHAVPQSTPFTLAATVPFPPPVSLTVSANRAAGAGSKAAVTLRARLMVTWQPPVPVHAPLQPANTEPVPGVAVSVTTVALSNGALHAAPHAIPAGVEPTVPPPAPARLTVSTKRPGGAGSNLAVTARARLIVTSQLPVPEQAPLQPENTEPVAGVAVSATTVPVSNWTPHAPPQLSPFGVEVTLPAPAPALVTVSANCFTLQVAVTLRAWLIVTWQLPVPVHAPPQPENSEPVAGVAVNVTTVPVSNGTLHAVPQLTPSGLEVTVPAPAPAFAMVSMNCCTFQVAVTPCAWLIVTWQAPAPVQAPSQPANTDPLAEVAVRVTTAALSNGALHAAPQLMPAGLEPTVPLPRPAGVTVSENCDGSASNAAVTARAWLIVIWQVPDPVHAPPQPANAEPEPGVAVSVTRVPGS